MKGRCLGAIVFATSLVLARGASAHAQCTTAQTCRARAARAVATLDAGGERMRGALETLRELDAALEGGCRLGDPDACRARIALHAARRVVRDAQGERVWDRTARQVVVVRDETFEPERSRTVMREAYDRLVAIERERATRADAVASYEAFVDEFPRDPVVSDFRLRIAELGLADVLARSRAQRELDTLFVFRDRVDQDALVEPTLFVEVLARGTIADAERFLRDVGTATTTPSAHMTRVRDRLRTLRFEAARQRAGAEGAAPLVEVLLEYPTGPEAVATIDAIAEHLASADTLRTFDGIVSVLGALAAPARPRAVEILLTLLARMDANQRVERSPLLYRSVEGEARRRIAALVGHDAAARGVMAPLFELLATAPRDPHAESALFMALVERGRTEELERYLSNASVAVFPADHVVAIRSRLRDGVFARALERGESEGIAPVIDAIVADPRHPSVPRGASAIVALLATESPTVAFDRLAPRLSEMPAHVREQLADAAVELLVRMGTRDRYQRFATASAHASLRQRQRLAEIMRSELTFADGIAGVALLRSFAAAFPGTPAARDAIRDASARESLERARRDQETLRQRASRFRR